MFSRIVVSLVEHVHVSILYRLAAAKDALLISLQSRNDVDGGGGAVLDLESSLILLAASGAAMVEELVRVVGIAAG